MKNSTITIRINDQEKARLAEIAKEKDISVAQIIREAIREYLAKIEN